VYVLRDSWPAKCEQLLLEKPALLETDINFKWDRCHRSRTCDTDSQLYSIHPLWF